MPMEIREIHANGAGETHFRDVPVRLRPVTSPSVGSAGTLIRHAADDWRFPRIASWLGIPDITRRHGGNGW